MIEAAKTTATAGELWVICVVMVVCLAFWLSMVAWADRHPVWRGRQMPEMPGPVLGGIHVAGGGRSVAPHRDAPPVLTMEESVELEQGGYERAPAGATTERGEGAAPATERPRVPGMPAQRSGDADRAERSAAGSGGGAAGSGGGDRGDGES